jgi:hypothetical protein
MEYTVLLHTKFAVGGEVNNTVVKYILVMVVLFLIATGINRTFDEELEKQTVGGIQLLIAASMIVLYLKSEAILELPNVISELDDRGSEFKRLYMQQSQIESAHQENTRLVRDTRREVLEELEKIRDSKTKILELNQYLADEMRSKKALCEQVYSIYCEFYEISEEDKQSESCQKIKNILVGICENLKQHNIRIVSEEHIGGRFEEATMEMVNQRNTDDRKLNGIVSSVIKPGLVEKECVKRAKVVVYKYEEEITEIGEQEQPGDQSPSPKKSNDEVGHDQAAPGDENIEGTSRGEENDDR